MRTPEKRKRYYLNAAKFDMQEFFHDRDDDAKMEANVRASFEFERRRPDDSPEVIC